MSTQATRPEVPVLVSMKDFRGRRTAMFGKTRLGKSNVVKLLASGMIVETAKLLAEIKEEGKLPVKQGVGQLIFDINGEYANDNPQDGDASIRSMYVDRCQVYALVTRKETPSRPLKLNFYEQPDACMDVISSLLAQDNKNSNYIRSFAAVTLPSIESLASLAEGEKKRATRKVQMFWAILHKAGFSADEGRLRKRGLVSGQTRHFDPHFDAASRKLVHGAKVPPEPDSLDALQVELEAFAAYSRDNSEPLKSSSGKLMFDRMDLDLLNFLAPASGTGPGVLTPYNLYHDHNAGDFVKEILAFLDVGKTVILDLGSATDNFRRYFSNLLSKAVFAHQERKFVTNALGKHFVQLYFEEAHNLFPVDDKDLANEYARFAKEGAKFHIGMVYSTQSPSTINKELLAQTENFFVGHLSSQDEAKALARVQVAFTGHEPDILRAKTPGYMRMLTQSHRFVIPVQALKFAAQAGV